MATMAPLMGSLPPPPMQPMAMMGAGPMMGVMDEADEAHLRGVGGRGGRSRNAGPRGGQRSNSGEEQPSSRQRRGSTKGRRGRGGPSLPVSTGTSLNANAASWSPGQQFQATQSPAPRPRAFGGYPYDMYYPYQFDPVHAMPPIPMHPLQPPFMQPPLPPANPPLPPGPPPQQQQLLPTVQPPLPPAPLAAEGLEEPRADDDVMIEPPRDEEPVVEPTLEEAAAAAEEAPTVGGGELDEQPVIEEPAAQEEEPVAVLEEPPTVDVEPVVEATEEPPVPSDDAALVAEEPAAVAEPATERAAVQESVVEEPNKAVPEEQQQPPPRVVEEPKKPLAEPNEKPAARPAKKSLKKRAAGYENRNSGDVLDAFMQQQPAVVAEEEEGPAPTGAPPSLPKKNEEVEEPEPEVIENWEDVAPSASRSEAAARPAHKPPARLDDEEEEEVVAVAERRRRVYTKFELLDLRSSVPSERPDSMPSFDVEKPKVEETGRRRLGPGGTARSSGPAAKDLDDARRSQPPIKPDDVRRRGAEAGTWARGQRVRGGGGELPAAAAEPLKKSAYRWDPSKIKANADATHRAVAGATSTLNKMTPENFDKLFGQLAAIEMLSLDMLKQVIRVVFEKAIDEPHFAPVYAELCQRMATEQATKVWPFVRVARDDESTTWSWLVDVQVDSSRLLPIQGDLDAASELLETIVGLDDRLLADHKSSTEAAVSRDDAEPDEDERLSERRSREARRLSLSGDDEHLKLALPEPVGVGQLKLVAADCVLRADRALVCFAAPQQRPGVLFAVLVEASALLSSSSGLCQFGGGGFASRDDAQAGAMKKASFRRLLLNQCEGDFKKVAGASAGATALAEMATQAMTELEEATARAKQEAIEKGLPPPIPPDVLTHEEWVVKLKRRMLGIVRFIGELFKQELLREKIMHECISLLVGKELSRNLSQIPDDESIEACAKLFLTIGKRLETPASSKAKLDAYFEYLGHLSKDRRLAARTRFMLQDLAETRSNGWKERRAKDGPHKLTQQSSQPNGGNNNASNNKPSSAGGGRRESQDVRRQLTPQQQQRPPPGQQQQQQQQRILPRDKKGHAPAPAKATPKATPAEDPSWTDERIDNRVKATLDEHAAIGDDNELFQSFDEMPRRAAARLASIAIEKYIIEGKAAQRESVYPSLAKLVASGRLGESDWATALGPSLEALYDVAVDVPKVYVWLADLVAMLLLLGALQADWLARDNGRRVLGDLNPNDDFDKELLAARAKFFAALLDALPQQASTYGGSTDAASKQQPSIDDLLLTFRPLAAA